MRRFSKYPELILLLLALVFLWGACTEQQENPMLIEDDKPPEISGFSPASQMAGRVVTVQGSYFAPLPDDNHAKVNSTEAEVLSVTREYLTVLVPQGASSGPISVTTRNGTALSEDELTVLGGPSPSISGFLPEKGIIGSSVTITGADFDPVAENNRVLFSGTEAQIIQNSTTSLVVIAPEATSGNIRVSNLAGTAVSRDPFLFILPEDTVNPIIKSYSPISGYAGDTVVIAGLNFDPTPAGNTVKFNDVPAQVTAAAADSLTVVVPDTTSGAISVGTSAGIGHSVLSFEIVPAGGYTVAEGQMGGAVQTGPLGLLGKVSIFAGGGIAAGPINGFGTDTRFDNPIGLASDGTNIYIVDSNNRMIRQLALANVEVTTLAGSGELGSDDGFGFNATFKSVNGIAAEGGFLYVTDLADHKIRKIEIATGIVSTFAGSGSFDTINAVGTAAAFKGPQGITSDGTNLYVVDSAGNTIRRIELATATVTTLAGSGAFGSQDGTGTLASFYRPHGIVAANGYLFVADTSSHKIRKVAISTGEVTTLAGSGLSGSADGTGSEAEFYNPERLATDGTHLYVTDSGNHKIRKVEIATGLVTTVAGAGTPGYEDETGTAATFNYPKGIIVIGPNLYVADSATTIRQIELGTSLVTTIAGDANALNAVNGIGREAKFLKPEGITSDGTNLYIADSYYRLIRKIRISNAKSFTVAGSGFFGSVDATATSASFNYPFGITTDGANLYVSDSQNHKIRKIVLSTGVVTSFAGTGGTGSDDGLGPVATFWQPTGITNDGTNLYVADTLNNKIRKIRISTGIVTTLAGSGAMGSAEGTGTEAEFNRPEGVTTDGTSLFVSDSGNNKIRKIVLATGVVSTLAGSGVFWSGNGTGEQASFRYPQGITTDGTNLYVTDSFGRRIRRVVISTAEVKTLAGSGEEGSDDGVGNAASFYLPTGITTDGTHLYVTDYLSNLIRKIE